MKVILYWLARLGVFLLCAGFLWFVVGWQDIISVIAAFILGWLLSYLLLPGMRRSAAAQMDHWISRSQRGLDAAAAEEDAEIEGKNPSP